MMNLVVKGKTILGIGAHPDDLDFGASGSVAKWVKMGAIIYYVILTDGSKGNENHQMSNKILIKSRQKEQLGAAKILGVKQVIFLNFVDGELANTPEVRKEVVKLIRKLKPEIVISLDPTFTYDENYGFINHPDHRTAGQITLDCVFPFARNARSFPELIEEHGLTSHSVEDILLINFKSKNFYVDISETLPLKLRALEKHISQYDDKQAMFDRVTSRAKDNGNLAHYDFAEAFLRIHMSS